MARALLKHSKILIFDEATSNVDLKTDAIIQNIIFTEFNDCTVLTVSHRIRSIINYDKVLVMENGSVVEFDTPSNLQDEPNSMFSRMVAYSQNESTNILIE
ncbi:ABC transporter C family member 5 [Thelohanellus kitauei]|uniref:ABC transporter C family member 5 n=1 Tax=Thelohanellus kitauei TaxID=669202 RepID=A0A0C2J2T6_THEKT|nr:ABC transporter C family member 5 [Thelohanellus kitauei]